jgi:tetratricopeptide (TPR) repeat protein
LLAAALLMAVSLVVYTRARPAGRSRPAAPPWWDARSPEEAALRQAVAAHPEDPEAHNRLGQYELRRALPFEAIGELAEALDRWPESLEARLGLAAALQAVYLPQMAEEALRASVASPAGDLARRLALARLRLTYAEADAAAQALRGVEESLNRSTEGLLLLGRVLQAKGDAPGAEAAYRRQLRLAPDHAEGYYRLGRLLLEAGRPADARDVLRAGRRAAPADARFPFYLGLTSMPGSGRESAAAQPSASAKQARALFEEALRLAPGHALPHYQLGLLAARAGEWERSARSFRAATEADPGHADALRELARALKMLGKRPYDAYYRGLYFSQVERPVEAVREFKAVADARPQSAEGALLVSRMYIQTMQYPQAAAAAEPALRRFPKDPEVYARLAVLYKLAGSRGAVERLCGQWRTALPQVSEPFWVLGKMRVTDGRVEEGIQLYEQALARDPQRAEYQLFLGQALAQRAGPGDLGRALDLIGRAVAKAPRDAAGRFQLGLLLLRLNRLTEARDQMLRALDLDPHQAPPYNSLAQITGQLRRPAEARLFARAVRLVEARLREEDQAMRRVWQHPRDAGAHLEAARFRRQTGDLAKAKAHLEQALELRPGWPSASGELARVKRALEAL